MRPLLHPPAEEMSVEGILYALADPVRVRIYIDVMASTCPQSCKTLAELNSMPMPKSTLSQHFKILREAGLIRSERKGIQMHNTTRCAELQERFGDMLAAILTTYAAQNSRR